MVDKQNVVKFNDKFSMKWDGYQWHLLDYNWNEEAEAYNKTPRTTYHGKIARVLGAIFERVCGEADGTVDDLKAKIKEAKELVDGFGITIESPEYKPVVISGLSDASEECF